MGVIKTIAELFNPVPRLEPEIEPEIEHKALPGPSQMELKRYTAGELLPSSMKNRPVWKDWNSQSATKDGLKASTWVYACIGTLAKAVSSANWQGRKRGADGKWEVVENSPLADLVNNPNPHYSRQTFFEEITYHLFLSGNATISKVSVRNTPVELWPLNPAYVTPYSGGDFIEKYYYERGEVRRDYKPDELIHLLFTDPENPYWGMSPMMAAAKTIDTDTESVVWNKVAMQNRAVADGVFSVKEPLSYEQWSRLRDQVKEQHQGSQNARTPWVLSGGAQWNQMSLSPVEMDFIESRKLGREEICAVFRVPPPMVGIYDKATLNNVQTARLIFWEDTITPILEDIKSTLNLALAPYFGDDEEIHYDVSHISVLLEIMKKKIELAKELWAMGVPFDVINHRLQMDIPAFHGDKVGYLPAAVMPAGVEMADTFMDEE